MVPICALLAVVVVVFMVVVVVLVAMAVAVGVRVLLLHLHSTRQGRRFECCSQRREMKGSAEKAGRQAPSYTAAV